MPSLREHLDSPQFPGEDPPTEEELRGRGFTRTRFTGGWVAAGQPRKRAYVIYVMSIVGGILLALPGPDDGDLFAVIGLAFIAFGLYGGAETILGKRFIKP